MQVDSGGAGPVDISGIPRHGLASRFAARKQLSEGLPDVGPDSSSRLFASARFKQLKEGGAVELGQSVSAETRGLNAAVQRRNTVFEATAGAPSHNESANELRRRPTRTKDLISKFESISSPSSTPTRPRPAPASSLRPPANEESSQVSNGENKSVVSICGIKDKDKGKGHSPLRQSFRNLLAVFNRKSPGGPESPTKPATKKSPQVPESPSPDKHGKLRECTSYTGLTPFLIPTSSRQPPSSTQADIRVLHEGTLLYVSSAESLQHRSSSTPLFPVWAAYTGTLHQTHLILRAEPSFLGGPAPVHCSVLLSGCVDVRSLSIGDLPEAEKAMLPEGMGTEFTGNHGGAPRVFELVFADERTERFAAGSVKERAAWVSAMWNAVLMTSSGNLDIAEDQRLERVESRNAASRFAASKLVVAPSELVTSKDDTVADSGSEAVFEKPSSPPQRAARPLARTLTVSEAMRVFADRSGPMDPFLGPAARNARLALRTSGGVMRQSQSKILPPTPRPDQPVQASGASAHHARQASPVRQRITHIESNANGWDQRRPERLSSTALSRRDTKSSGARSESAAESVFDSYFDSPLPSPTRSLFDQPGSSSLATSLQSGSRSHSRSAPSANSPDATRSADAAVAPVLDLLEIHALNHHAQTAELACGVAGLRAEVQQMAEELQTALARGPSATVPTHGDDSAGPAGVALMEEMRSMLEGFGRTMQGMEAKIIQIAADPKSGSSEGGINRGEWGLIESSVLEIRDRLRQAERTEPDGEDITRDGMKILSDEVSKVAGGMDATHEDLRGDLRQILERLEGLKLPEPASSNVSSATKAQSNDSVELHAKVDALLETCKSLTTSAAPRYEGHPSNAGAPEVLADVLNHLREGANHREAQAKEQADSVRYLGELNQWLATFVTHSTNQTAATTEAVQQLARMLAERASIPGESVGAGVVGSHEGLLLEIRGLLRDRSEIVAYAGDSSARNISSEVLMRSIDQQRLDQERLLRGVAGELSNQISGERLRFVEAMKEATSINIQAQITQFKEALMREVMLMTHDVGRLRLERQGLEEQIAGLRAQHATGGQAGPPLHLPQRNHAMVPVAPVVRPHKRLLGYLRSQE